MNNNNKVTILYERLSRDDGEDGISNSILNQRQLLEDYAERNGLVPFLHIQDDGYSGTNWDRPGWQELIAKVESDEVCCICIKDSSRLGRDYLRAGLFRELFRERNVRLIMVNDGFDSERGEDDFTPFREIMSEWYARDTSKKIKSVITAKGKSGKPTTNCAPYGFVKDPNDKNKWLIDEPAATVVHRIFQMTMEGIGPYEIARALTEEKVERPSYYQGSRGRGTRLNNYDGEQPYTWCCSTVTDLLSKPEYAGHTVNFRTRRENFKSKKTTLVPSDEWLIFENTHEAIVSQEVFDTVQKLRGTPRRPNRLGEANPLTGLLFCSDCGSKLFNKRKSNPTKHKNPNGKIYFEKPQDTYQCSAWKLNNTKFNKVCSAHHIQTAAVREIILDILRKTTVYVREHEQDFVEKVRESSIVRQGETAKAYQKQIAKNEKRSGELKKIFRSLYEDKALGKLSEERFEEMTAEYGDEQAEINRQSAALQAELDIYNADNMRADKFVELVRRYTRFEELTNVIINEFIDKIIVHEGVWSERTETYKGTRTQQVDVYLKYIGKFEAPDMRTPEQIEADRIEEEKKEEHRRRNREYMRKRAAERKESDRIAAEAAEQNPSREAEKAAG
jgi:hypothetical protein